MKKGENQNFEVTFDGSNSYILPTDKEADDYEIYNSFRKAKTALINNLSGRIYALQEAKKNIQKLTREDIKY